MRTSVAARLRNRAERSRCRLAEKRVLVLRDKTAAQAELVEAYTLLDHMAAKGLYHRNTIARHKSKLARYVNSLQS
jgi:small subunit ribosomal protein S20